MKNELRKWEQPVITDLFPVDEQFEISNFRELVVSEEKKSELILTSAKKAIRKAVEKGKEGSQYVLDLDDDQRESLTKGEIELVKTKSGEMLAQFRGKKGRFGKPIPIKEELKEAGISPEELEVALQMEAMKHLLQGIASSMKDLEERVQDVLQGQRNDRIGLFYSGYSLYLESRTITDKSLKKAILSQALKAISDASSEMIQDLRMSMEHLFSGRYKNSIKKIDEHIEIIHQCYDIILRAVVLKATIYQESREIGAMLTAIDEYGRFVEKLIVPYAGRLSELDSKSKLIEAGTWGSIAKTLAQCGEFRQQVLNGNVYQLYLGGESSE